MEWTRTGTAWRIQRLDYGESPGCRRRDEQTGIGTRQPDGRRLLLWTRLGLDRRSFVVWRSEALKRIVTTENSAMSLSRSNCENLSAVVRAEASMFSTTFSLSLGRRRAVRHTIPCPSTTSSSFCAQYPQLTNRSVLRPSSPTPLFASAFVSSSSRTARRSLPSFPTTVA